MNNPCKPLVYKGFRGRSEETCKAQPCKICCANHPIVFTFGENWRHPHYVPLAVPKIACSLFASHNFDRCAYEHSLYHPQDAVVFIAQSRQAPVCVQNVENLNHFNAKIKRVIPKGITLFMVGVKRLELPTSCPQTHFLMFCIVQNPSKSCFLVHSKCSLKL